MSKKTAKEILMNKKNQVTAEIDPDCSIYECALRMKEEDCGALLVMKAGKLLGIISERDLVRRVIIDRWDPALTTVETVMSSFVITVPDWEEAKDCYQKFLQYQFRHLPVENDQGSIIGVITERDLLDSTLQ